MTTHRTTKWFHGGSISPIRAWLGETRDYLDQVQNSAGHITGISTGLDDFDLALDGLQPGSLIVIGGRPSMGKTSLAINIATHVASNRNLATAIFSMDMSGRLMTMRMIASLGRIDFRRLRAGRMDTDDVRREAWAMERLGNAPLYLDDNAALSINKLRSSTRKLKRKRPDLSLIVIDFLQLLRITGIRGNRTDEISEIMHLLKSLARELNVSVIVLSQVARGVERRPDKRPLLGDLLGSGSIEEYADVVVMLYRDAYYVENSPDRDTAELIIAKQQNGPTRSILVGFQERYPCFENLPPLNPPVYSGGSGA